MRTIHSSGSPFEKPIGFSRAVRIDQHISVSGTAPLDASGNTVHPGDLLNQTRRCLEIIKEAIEGLGGSIEDTIRTRIFLKDIQNWKEAAQAHGEMFSGIQPACTFVEVSRFIDEDWLVEIEADCIVSNQT